MLERLILLIPLILLKHFSGNEELDLTGPDRVLICE